MGHALRLKAAFECSLNAFTKRGKRRKRPPRSFLSISFFFLSRTLIPELSSRLFLPVFSFRYSFLRWSMCFGGAKPSPFICRPSQIRPFSDECSTMELKLVCTHIHAIYNGSTLYAWSHNNNFPFFYEKIPFPLLSCFHGTNSFWIVSVYQINFLGSHIQWHCLGITIKRFFEIAPNARL